ncbi:hypothetical protein, conserved, partial [Eimeria tenella]
VPVTFEESLIAFKTGLHYARCVGWAHAAFAAFESAAVSTESVLSLVAAFAEKEKDLSLLLLHLPPAAAAAAASALSHRQTLQTATWNAFVAFWSIQEVYGLLEGDLSSTLSAVPSFAASPLLSGGPSGRFWVPESIWGPLEEELQQLFRGLPAAVGGGLAAASRAAVDAVLHVLQQQVRRRGFVEMGAPEQQQQGPPQGQQQLQQEEQQAQLERLEQQEQQVQKFFRSQQHTAAFCKLLQQAAAAAAFAQQLEDPEVKAVLTRRPQRFGFESWLSLVQQQQQQQQQQSPEATVLLLQRLFTLVCSMIPASAETRALKTLGKPTEDVQLFRTLVDSIVYRLLLLEQQQQQQPPLLPPSFAHYPLCTAIRAADCSSFAAAAAEDPALARSCKELEEQTEEPLAERCECSKGGRSSSNLLQFFVGFMSRQLSSSIVQDQWSRLLRMQLLQQQEPALFPLPLNPLAAALHEAAVQLADAAAAAAAAADAAATPAGKAAAEAAAAAKQDQDLAAAANRVYTTMCRYADYMIAANNLKETNACTLVGAPPEGPPGGPPGSPGGPGGPPGPLLALLKRLLQQHSSRVLWSRLGQQQQGLLAMSYEEIVKSKSLQQQPSGALKAGRRAAAAAGQAAAAAAAAQQLEAASCARAAAAAAPCCQVRSCCC